MRTKFKLGRSVYFILTFILFFGLFLEFIRSNYALTLGYTQFQDHIEDSHEDQIDSDSRFENKEPEYLLLFDEESQLSQAVTTNIQQTLTYMKKEYGSESVQDLAVKLEGFQTVIISFEALSKIGDITQLEQYVANGGTVIFAVRPAVDDAFIYLYRKLGIYEVGGLVTTTGIQLKSNLLLNQNDLKIDGEFMTNSSLFVGLEDKSSVYAWSADDIPLLWEREYEDGRFILFNGTMLDSKSSRGVLGATISLGQDDFIYPIMNVKMAYIDGFPSQIPSGRNETIDQTFRKDIGEFYRDIWWPNIQKTAVDYGLRYTSAFVKVNDSKVQAPYNDGIERKDFIKYVRELMKVDGELALKGYNNVPLIVGENYWQSSSNIYRALEHVKQFAVQSFPNYQFRSYYPPNLYSSAEGLQIVQTSIPSVGNVITDYTKSLSEFSHENDLTEVPVITNGYAYSDETQWAIMNAIDSLGVYSHQISPWEVLTSGGGWNELLSAYNEMNKDIKHKYPWLRAMTSSEAGQVVERFLETDVLVTQTDQSLIVTLSHFTDDFYFIFRTDNRVEDTINCVVEEIEKGIYLVTAKQATFEIRLGGLK